MVASVLLIGLGCENGNSPSLSDGGDDPGHGDSDLHSMEDSDAPSTEPFELEFEEIIIHDEPYKRVKNSCLDALPPALYAELLAAAIRSGRMAEEERDSVDFTATSSQEANT